jgi:hypothetical protein
MFALIVSVNGGAFCVCVNLCLTRRVGARGCDEWEHDGWRKARLGRSVLPGLALTC